MNMSRTDGNQDSEGWFERVWKYREESIYPLLFGSCAKGIFTIPASVFTDLFAQESCDPRWLHCGVFEYAPSHTRDSWLYVTSGMSNDWESDTPDSTKLSGLGCEFVFETAEQAEWAIRRLLQLMAFQILLCHGRYPGKEPLNDFDRVPMRGPICPGSSIITHLMMAPPSQFPRTGRLESGEFDFFQTVGISESEAAFARSNGGDALLARLVAEGFFPVTDPTRNEIATDIG